MSYYLLNQQKIYNFDFVYINKLNDKNNFEKNQNKFQTYLV